MPKALKYTFLIHAIVSVAFGAPLLLLPGRFLALFAWEPVDAIISRLLGAGLLALAWGSFRGWQATDRAQVRTLIEMDIVFTVLGSAGILRHLFTGAYYAWPVWMNLAVLVVFALIWIYWWLKK